MDGVLASCAIPGHRQKVLRNFVVDLLGFCLYNREVLFSEVEVEMELKVRREEVWDRGKCAEVLWELLDAIFSYPAYGLAHRLRALGVWHYFNTIIVEVKALVNSSNEIIDDFH